jgi:hypothetical protein
MSCLDKRAWAAPMLCVAACLNGSAALAQACYTQPVPRPLTAEQSKTLVITDRAILDRPEFTFGNTLGAIINSSSPGRVQDGTAERIALLASMIRSFRMTERVNPESGLNLRVKARPNEAALDPIKLLAPGPGGMKPIALFNRWDLAPDDFKHCGEHRIVFARESDPADKPPSRFFLIFEAAVDNPHPANDKSGCQGIVHFWKGLEGKTSTAAGEELAKFYFAGLDSNADGQPDFQPVIHAQHLGAPYGQVRGNIFMTQGDVPGHPWQLREWRVSLGADGAPLFAADTVKKNPHAKLYDDVSDNEIEGGFDGARRAFAAEFLASYLAELTELDPRSATMPASGNDLIAGVGANFHGRFDTFTSISQGRGEDPEALAKGLKTALGDALKSTPVPPACGLTADHVLARAGTISCGGCHQFSASREIAPGVPWPALASGGFVHVKEDGELSPALLNHLLPARHDILMKDFPIVVAAPAPLPPPPATTATAASARDALNRVQASENRLDAIEALREFESQVQAIRQGEAQKPGAFIRYRRVH